METDINTYRLNQGKKEYIFTTSIIGNKIKLACKNSSNENNIKYTREFSIEQLKQIDEIFNIINSPSEASDYIDKALSKQKVRVSEEINHINICFYITTNGITNQIDIPLYDPSFNSNVNQNISHFDTNNNTGNEITGQNNIDLLNSAFAQNNQGQFFSQIGNYNTNYGQGSNTYNYNQYVEKPPIIGPVDDSSNQYPQNYDTNQFFQNYQVNDINNNQYINQMQGNEMKPFITQVDNEENNAKINEQINQFLHNTNSSIEQTGTEDNKDEDLKTLTTTKVLPIQTTSRVLPVLGPFTSLEGVDLYQLANMNAQKSENIVYQPIENAQTENYYQQNIQSRQVVKKEHGKATINKNANVNKNINKNTKINNNANATANINKNIKNAATKKQEISDKRTKNVESDEINMLRSQLSELEPLRKKVAEMEVLRSQLTELNSLRAQVAEYKSIEEQFKDIKTLRSQVDQLSLENEKLKIRIEELEDIKSKYEEEIQSLKENEKMFSMQSGMSNNMENKENDEEDIQELAIKGDIIHNTSELDLLVQKINKLNQKLTLNLLYKATVDSDKAVIFHRKCDNAKSTLVLVETDKGKRFGGYTTRDWSGDCVDKKDEEAFVFSLDKMMTYDSIPEEDAIGCYPKFGPIFLGCQIRIYDKAFSKGGTTFERGLNYETEEDYELSGGERCYNVKEIEVYEVIKE